MASNLLAGLNIGGDSSVDLLTLSKASGPVSFPLVTTPEFVKLLATSGIQGPHHLSGVCLDRRGRLIGQGSQFMVFEDTLPALDSMVMKRINADVIEHPLVSQELDDRRKGHLRTLWLEILALSHPPIRAHPNITKLLSWGFDYPNYGRKMALPVLFAEKALCSLEDLLTKPRAYEEKSLSVAVRYQLCLDILEGLICLHRAEIVHGDIKPANILIFRNADPQVPFVAKLNDFGMCIPLQPEVQVDCNMYGGTPGWRAPEVIEASRTKGSTHKASLYLCDVFTFGLVVCSVFFCSGSAPFDQEVVSTETYAKKALRLIDDQAPATGIEEDLMSKLKVFFCNTLSMDPAQRHGLHRGMLATSNHAFSTWAALHDQQSKESNLQRSPSSLQKDNYSHVDIANFWSFLDRPLLAELETYIGPDFDPAKQQTLSGEILFGMAVAVASYRSPGFQQKFVRYVSYAAQASDLSAQGIVCRILEAHGMAEKENESIKLDWLQQAASTGSLAAAEDLMRIDPPRFRAARIAFRRSGGYNYPNNANYTIAEAKPDDAFSMTVRDVSQTLIAVGTPDLALDHRGNCLLHYAATYGNCDVIEYLVGQRGADVNIQNHQDETPLYKACLSGDGATVKLLIQLGADPTIVSQPFHISCLHWLFTFDGEDMEEVAQLLHAQGKAAINATVTRSTVKQPLVTRHFPFRWPFGMPLHWAIAQRSQLAANVLLERNADINGFNLTEEDNDRETALSMAVYRRDADMVEFLIRKNADATIIDSNGRNLIHILVVNDPFNRACRLSRSIWSWTMHGSADSHIKEVRRCLQALLNCGVSLDHCRKRSQTPLVDAIENEDGCGALVLLQAGADTDILCPTGESLTQRWLRVDARRLDYPEIFKPVLSELLNHAGNLDHHDSFAGETIIHEAALCVCSNEQFEYVFDLLSSSTTQATMNLNVRDRYGATPFLKVLESLDTTDTIIRANKLMERGADISLKNNDGEDFLHYLCSNFKLSDQETLNFAKVLLKRWQLPEQKSIAQGSISKRDGSTALIKAVSSGKLECLKLLVDLGVDVDSVIKSGNMALDRAIHAADITRSSFIGKTMDSLGRAEKAEAIENHTVFEHVVSWGAYPTNGDNTDTKTQYFDRPAIVAYLKHLGAKRAQDPRLDVSNLFLTDVDLEKACCEFSTGVGFKIARKEPYVPSKQPFLDIWLPIYHISWDDHRHLPHPTQCVCCFIFASLPPALRETRVLTATLLDEILKHHPSFEDIEDFLRKS